VKECNFRPRGVKMKRIYFLIFYVLGALLIPYYSFCLDDDYQINTNDVVKIFVWQHEDLSGNYTVMADGYISVPLAGRIQVVGKTISELTEEIISKFSRYFVEPKVAVSLDQFTRKVVYVIGSVKTPGEVFYSEKQPLSHYLGFAGGPSSDAKLSETQIIRRENNEVIYIHLDLNDILKRGEIDKDLILLPGDTIYIPAKSFSIQDYRFLIAGIAGTLSILFIIGKIIN
jgi:polysaccharide export outer membrane protein